MSYSKVIIDIKKGIAYFPDEKVYKKVRKYRVLNGCTPDSAKYNFIIGVDSSTLVKFNKQIPGFITPGVIFTSTNDCGGVSFIKTRDYTIHLISHEVYKTGKVDYSSFFTQVNIAAIKNYNEFFY